MHYPTVGHIRLLRRPLYGAAKYECSNMMRTNSNMDIGRRYFQHTHMNTASSSTKEKRYYKGKELNLCTPLNHTVNLCHERMDGNFYAYDISATVFRLLKCVHKLEQREVPKIIPQTSTENTFINYQVDKLFYCYVSIYNNISKNLFLKLTLEFLKSPALHRRIVENGRFYEQVLCEIVKCADGHETMDKSFYYEYVIKILSVILKNKNAFNDIQERIFFQDIINMIREEKNINYFIKNFTFLISCISLYKRRLKKEIHFNRPKDDDVRMEYLAQDNQILLMQRKKQLLQKCLPIILDIFNKLHQYNHLNDVDICNIVDFLNEFKESHKIKLAICKDIHKYFKPSSDMKHLCLILYLLTQSKNEEMQLTQVAYKHIYNIIFCRKSELTDPKNVNLFLLGVTRWRRKVDVQQNVRNTPLGRGTQSDSHPDGDTERVLRRRKTYSGRSKGRLQFSYGTKSRSTNLQLCQLLRHKIIKKQKMKKEKKMYFWIKYCLLQFIKKGQLKAKYVKTFYEYFCPYHISRKCTRKKNYISPLSIVQRVGKV
ncbi:conserved Plasmodium protein, unknown function [Plasmodium knowlesi strain H]|uniref:Uncharacterized protein n=3 Tax=Plasmodium knowlesi TaxID=5850 RepID=A0A5K1UTI6_PLAKH|nr:conserved Plasmodium protein, unknown function [Plasmodium knowlesi strain H]OTN64020.1 Uncharacterized protein PKNOH_S140246700 [Plasmodium knowlesi]CAA9990886.1 conserved Plasmodium protein, unknown function [Plasmodium knowlesi strain H]SBO20890.1 conserved Plasmodium protein, unknown function [Plasmodium knowlesi strain H]SBO21352.1 conserved Plasmodium protein, unknown function [Plasmodium knowlesi strain H]VVS80360.1 conserved Plasmodium protein, unknown function [Plasmodium knowlesi |eukprot:XP_002262172.1 hypothetical protein, conserved in Plasmodium species [Plasmodium knowlesi strain H]